MAALLLPDALWNLIEPLLPTPASKPQGGRPPCQTARASRVFCSYCAAGFLGGCYRKNELRFGDDLLAKVTGLAGGRHLATDPLRLARLVSTLQPD